MKSMFTTADAFAFSSPVAPAERLGDPSHCIKA